MDNCDCAEVYTVIAGCVGLQLLISWGHNLGHTCKNYHWNIFEVCQLENFDTLKTLFGPS